MLKRKNGEYHVVSHMGRGTFGDVTMRKCTRTGDVVAVKSMLTDEDGVPATTLREIAILQSINHVAVVKYIDSMIVGNSVHLVMELCDCDVKRFMRSRGRGFDDEEMCTFGRQLLEGVAFLHGRGIMHRDLKPQNILMNRVSATLKIGDFGLARFVVPDRTYTLEVITLWYRPPELLLGVQTYGPEVDVWSIGCVLHEMQTNVAAFAGDSCIDELFRIFQAFGRPGAGHVLRSLCHWNDDLFPNWTQGTWDSSSALGKLITELCHLDPTQRPTAASTVHHAYFATHPPV